MNKKEEKNKIGRPKPTDKKNKKKAILLIALSLIIVFLVACFCFLDYALINENSISNNTYYLQGKASKNKKAHNKKSNNKKSNNKKSKKKATAAKKKNGSNSKSRGKSVKKTTTRKKTTKKLKIGSNETSNSKNINSIKGTVNLKAIEKLSKNNCPIAADIKGVTTSNGSTFYENKLNYSIQTNNLSSYEINNLYVAIYNYNKDRKLKYNINGKSTTEKVGNFKSPEIVKLTSLLKKNGNKYEITFNNIYLSHVVIYSGSKKCYNNYIIKDKISLNSNMRRFPLAKYIILTKDGAIKGIQSGTTVTSSDSKVLKINSDLKKNSYKATSQGAKSGHEKSVTTKITFTNEIGTGSFNVSLPKKYWSTGYLLNPLTKSRTKSINITKFGKAKETKNSKGAKIYGIEINATEGKNVYAMDAGYITKVVKTPGTKGTYGCYVQMKSTVNKKDYYFTYAHLKEGSIKVKKGDRVYKGQVLGKVGKTASKSKNLSKAKLFISMTMKYVNKDKQTKYLSVLVTNFIGRNLYIGNITAGNFKLIFRKYVPDSELCKYTLYGDVCNVETVPVEEKDATDQDEEDGTEDDPGYNEDDSNNNVDNEDKIDTDEGQDNSDDVDPDSDESDTNSDNSDDGYNDDFGDE